MQNTKIVIAGGTGFIGQALANYFGNENEVVILSRNKSGEKKNNFSNTHLTTLARYVYWDAKNGGEWEKEIVGCDIVINLSGKSVNCRYTPANKKEIFDSRTNATEAIGNAIRKSTKPPGLWLNAASATIYPHTYQPLDESFTAFEDDFSVQVCKLWEKTFFEQRTPFTRKIAMRMAITLGSGGILAPYFNLIKFGLGGRQGSGKQMYSWIHIEDTCSAIEWFFQNKNLEGVFNLSSPQAVTNNHFMQALRKAAGHSCGLPAYEWMLQLGGKIIGTEPELVLKSRWVFPTALIHSGFSFRFPDIESSFENIIRQTPRKHYHLF